MQIAGDRTVRAASPFPCDGIRGGTHFMSQDAKEKHMETTLAFVAVYTFATASLFVLWIAKGVTVYEKGGPKCLKRNY